MRRALLWYPGASIAVADVASGLQAGLEANGVEVIPFRLDARIDASLLTLTHLHEQQRSADPDAPPFTLADAYYHANMGVLERALRYDVEWVFMVSGLYQHPDYAVMLRRAGRRVALIATEAPYQTRQELRLAPLMDHVFVNERSVLPQYRAINPASTYLPAAWHPAIHQMQATPAPDTPAHDVVFVGTGFIERCDLLSAIDWTGIDFGLYGVWELLDETDPVRAHLRDGAIHNAQTAALYRRARVGLNLHRTSVDYEADTAHIAGAYSLNPRCYELAACGVCFVSDARPEVADVFGGDLPTFETPQEAEALIRHALAEPAWRVEVAGRCHARIQAHSWTHRAAQVLEALTAPAVVAA